jgi:hypothetical protein
MPIRPDVEEILGPSAVDWGSVNEAAALTPWAVFDMRVDVFTSMLQRCRGGHRMPRAPLRIGARCFNDAAAEGRVLSQVTHNARAAKKCAALNGVSGQVARISGTTHGLAPGIGFDGDIASLCRQCLEVRYAYFAMTTHHDNRMGDTGASGFDSRRLHHYLFRGHPRRDTSPRNLTKTP